MGLLVKTTSFGTLFVVRPTFLCTIESLKITISRLFYKPREDLITRMRETMKNWEHIVNCGHYNKLWGL